MRPSVKLISLAVLILCACNNASTLSKIHPGDSIVMDTTSIAEKTVPLYDRSRQPIEDTIANIKFPEFSVSINRLILYDEDKTLDSMHEDTAYIYAEIGESLEGQTIHVDAPELTNIRIAQSYQTSVVISDEGPHCDLLEWEHYHSDWRQLKATTGTIFIGEKYNAAEHSKFPPIKIADLKKAVRKHCGNEWVKLVGEIFPGNATEVGISRYFLKITGQRKDNGQLVTKLIVLETPMGC